ncbi:MAG: hypothetical protein NTV05_13375 [Acidobacteria bacterium]|nr:hypothetical protein [Acidobacteriota bacterium]
MAKKPSWGLIILGIAALVVVVGVGLVAVAGYVIYQQFAFQTTTTSVSSAEDELAQVAARFADQPPLLEIRDGEPVLNRQRQRSSGAAKPIDALHIIVWQPDERRLVKLNIPFWLLRLTRGRPIRLSGHGSDGESDPISLHITAGNLERYGPGLVMNHKDADGKRVLVWAE